MLLGLDGITVSIHAPVMDAIKSKKGLRVGVIVSIHAPVMDAMISKQRLMMMKAFQSTRP